MIENVNLFLYLDINECPDGADATDTDDCHDNATCTDNKGSYTCMCDVGYTGNGTFCEGKYTKCSLIYCHAKSYIRRYTEETSRDISYNRLTSFLP